MFFSLSKRHGERSRAKKKGVKQRMATGDSMARNRMDIKGIK